MKREEKLAHQYLISEGFKAIKYEPDGNIPPDFLLNNSIAVEVRRLNQHYKGNEVPIALEDLEFKLLPKIRSLLGTYTNSHLSSSAFLVVRYQRPLVADKKLISDIDKVLKNHIPHIKEEREYELRDNLTIKVFPSEKKLSSVYVIGIINDHDVGGFVVSEIHRNLKFILEEKTNKVNPYYLQYNEWWLVLIDYISYGLNDHDINQLKAVPIKKTIFNKIIIIPHIDSKKGIILDKFED